MYKSQDYSKHSWWSLEAGSFGTINHMKHLVDDLITDEVNLPVLVTTNKLGGRLISNQDVRGMTFHLILPPLCHGSNRSDLSGT